MELFKKHRELPSKIGKDEKSRIAIVFVHGLGGGRETWHQFSTLLAKEWTYHKSFDLYYPHLSPETWIAKQVWRFIGSPRIAEKFEFLIRVLEGENIEVLSRGLQSYITGSCDKYEAIILVGHSMGGLIGKQYLVDEFSEFKTSPVKKYITYATPHFGSNWANLGVTEQVRQMHFYKSGYLIKLIETWNSLSIFKHVRPTYFVATRDVIVNRHSASSFQENDPEIIWVVGLGHKSIINPTRRDDISMSNFLRILRDIDIDTNEDEDGGIEQVNLAESDEDENEL